MQYSYFTKIDFKGQQHLDWIDDVCKTCPDVLYGISNNFSHDKNKQFYTIICESNNYDNLLFIVTMICNRLNNINYLDKCFKKKSGFISECMDIGTIVWARIKELLGLNKP